MAFKQSEGAGGQVDAAIFVANGGSCPRGYSGALLPGGGEVVQSDTGSPGAATCVANLGAPPSGHLGSDSGMAITTTS